jgi:hypothetical protein
MARRTKRARAPCAQAPTMPTIRLQIRQMTISLNETQMAVTKRSYS